MNEEKFTDKIFTISINYFHRWYGLVCSIFSMIIISLIIYKLIPEGAIPLNWYAISILIIVLLLIFYWFYYVFYYPKRSRDRLGVAIAVHVENSEDTNYFEKDFLNPFKSKISELNLPFDVLVLKNHQSEKIENQEDARKILKKTKAQFCIWGSIKKRKNAPEGNKYFFSLRGIVVHQPIYEVQSVLLRKEFDTLLPNTLIFEDRLQFENFDFRANQAVIALDYITGRAALLSGDFNIAIQLHESLFQAMQGGQQIPISKDILKKLLSLEYDQKASFELYSNLSADDYKKSVKKSLQYDSNNYGTLLKKAIMEFNNGKGDPSVALNTIKLAKSHITGAYHWLYSQSFLHFWMEEYDEAIKCCDKLKEKSYVGENFTIKEVITFNESLLKTIKKPQLYYWLGFISYVKDKNPSMADNYFQKFIEESDDTMENLKIRANSYMSSIKKEIGY
ncbi:MAG: hypothetical protein WC898_02960 [Candidatus Paceibacterota bacterium]|jgi:tetratricopeptide (TPR) repeat protein